MALGNGSTPNGGVAQEKAPVVNGNNVETLPRTEKQVSFVTGAYNSKLLTFTGATLIENFSLHFLIIVLFDL